MKASKVTLPEYCWLYTMVHIQCEEPQTPAIQIKSMCSTFDNLLERRLLKERFGLTHLPSDLGEEENRRPNDKVLAITHHGYGECLTWGFKADWTKQLLINARSETLLSKQSFAHNHDNRCLVPASAWYEWRTDDIGKHKNRIDINGVDTFAIAAIHDGGRICPLTCPAHPQIAPIHARMPLLIAPPQYQNWLDSTIKTKELQPLLQTPTNIAFRFDETQKHQAQMRLF